MSNPYPRRQDERGPEGLAWSRLRLRHGARVACKRLRRERDEARRERDLARLKLDEWRERLRRVRLPEPMLNGRPMGDLNMARVALVHPSLLDFSAAVSPPHDPTIQIATFERISQAIDINGVTVTWTTWRPVRTEYAE
jgi:hypothetical protein